MIYEDLTPDQRGRLAPCRYDWFVEKHEGPWDWERCFEYGTASIMRIDDFDVLLPLSPDQLANITIERCIPSADGNLLTIFLKDTTHWTPPSSGFLAICERPPDIDLYVTTVYHQRYDVSGAGLANYSAR